MGNKIYIPYLNLGIELGIPELCFSIFSYRCGEVKGPVWQTLFSFTPSFFFFFFLTSHKKAYLCLFDSVIILSILGFRFLYLTNV
jgi:hypothetical protein